MRLEVVYEFVDGETPKKARRIILFGDPAAVDLRFATSTDEFEKWQPPFDEILASLQVK